jgi:hypothetical protein
MGSDNTLTEFYFDFFGCPVGALPMKYLGVHVTSASLRAGDLSFLEARLIKNLDAWIGNSASSRGILTLINYSLSWIPSYIMLMLFLNKPTLKKLDKPGRRFFWKAVVVKRNIIC